MIFFKLDRECFNQHEIDFLLSEYFFEKFPDLEKTHVVLKAPLYNDANINDVDIVNFVGDNVVRTNKPFSKNYETVKSVKDFYTGLDFSFQEFINFKFAVIGSNDLLQALGIQPTTENRKKIFSWAFGLLYNRLPVTIPIAFGGGMSPRLASELSIQYQRYGRPVLVSTRMFVFNNFLYDCHKILKTEIEILKFMGEKLNIDYSNRITELNNRLTV